MIYRAATSDDEPFLYRLYSSTRADEIAAWGWPPAEAETFLRLQWDAQRRYYAAAFPDAEHQIVCDGGRPIGRLVVWRGRSYLRLVDIALLPVARRQGIGARIILDLQQRARTLGRPIRLQVTPDNPAARLYRRLGFVEVERRAVGVEMEWPPT